jgi:hypothetical protein
VQLTDKMLAVRGQTQDPSAKIEMEETVWRKLLETARTPAERGRLNAMTPEQRGGLIRLHTEQLQEQAEEGGAD